MRVLIVAACLLLLALTAFADVPSNLVVTRDGYDWVWAAPCSPVMPSCSGHDLTMQYGFTLPTIGEWTASFTDTADIYNAFTLGGQLCASTYFDSGYTHCDSSDLQSGYIWGAPVPSIANAFGGDTNLASEAFLVRGEAAAVPEPSSFILLFSVGVATVIARRRRG